MSRELLKLALDALKDDKQLIEDWGSYASSYFQEKHNLLGDIASKDELIYKIESYLSDNVEPEPIAYKFNGELFWPSEYKPIAEPDDGAIPLYVCQPDQHDRIAALEEDHVVLTAQLAAKDVQIAELEIKSKDTSHLRDFIPEWLCETCNLIQPTPKSFNINCPDCGGILKPTNKKQRDLEAEIKKLQEENFALAAQQCPYDDGLMNDEYGNSFCQYKKELDKSKLKTYNSFDDTEKEKLEKENKSLKLQVSAAKTIIASQEKQLVHLGSKVNQLPMLDSEKEANEQLTNELDEALSKLKRNPLNNKEILDLCSGNRYPGSFDKIVALIREVERLHNIN